MQINATNNNLTASATGSTTATKSAATAAKGKTLDMNDFFKLITAQLQNQSIYNPVDDSQFMAQMAQFSSLQSMQDMGKMIQTTYAVSLIGRNVAVAGRDDDGALTRITGTVEKIGFNAGQPELLIDGKYFQTKDIIEVVG